MLVQLLIGILMIVMGAWSIFYFYNQLDKFGMEDGNSPFPAQSGPYDFWQFPKWLKFSLLRICLVIATAVFVIGIAIVYSTLIK